MDHAENISIMVPPSSLGLGLGSTPNPLHLSQDIYPNLSQQNSNKKRLRQDSDDKTSTSAFFKPENFARFLIIKSDDDEKPINNLSSFIIEKQNAPLIGTVKTVKNLKAKFC